MNYGLDTKLQLKALTERGEFEGLAAVYGNTDRQNDVIERGAFGETLKRRSRVPILWQHDTTEPIGIGDLQDTPQGLVVQGRLALSVARAQEAHALLKIGALDGLSIGYSARDYSYDRDGRRRLKQLDLHEISLVTFPANEEARVAAVKQRLATVDPEEAVAMLLIDMRLTAAELRLRSNQRMR